LAASIFHSSFHSSIILSLTGDTTIRISAQSTFTTKIKRDRKTKQIIFSVKAGHVQSAYVRDLRGVIEREDAQIEVLICMEASTKPMLKEAAEAGFYKPPGLEDGIRGFRFSLLKSCWRARAWFIRGCWR